MSTSRQKSQDKDYPAMFEGTSRKLQSCLPILIYIAQHPNCTKYDLSTKMGDKIPYSTVSDWVRDLFQQGFLLEIALGKTRVGIDKIGYRITYDAISYIAFEVEERDQLSKILRINSAQLPLPPDLIEKATKSVDPADIPDLLQKTAYIRPYKQPDNFRRVLDLVLFRGLIYQIRWTDLAFARIYITFALNRLIKLNSSFPSAQEQVLSKIRRQIDSTKRLLGILEILVKEVGR